MIDNSYYLFLLVFLLAVLCSCSYLGIKGMCEKISTRQIRHHKREILFQLSQGCAMGEQLL